MSKDTFVLNGAPAMRKNAGTYRPQIITTVGQRPACLVNASVTYAGSEAIYVFGGFDQYTDEVYNHVLKLNLNARQWSLVDNYGDIPGVRMGHTASLWQGNKLLVYGGENEHRIHLSDIVIFDIDTAHWTQPDISGPIPRGRARHAAVIHDDKLFICGGISGSDNGVLDDICFLDLKTWTWSRSWRFVSRYDHSIWIWQSKIWLAGGMAEGMERTNELWWLDFHGSPAFESGFSYGNVPADGVQSNSATQIQRSVPVAPGAINTLKIVSSPNLPIQNVGVHFHVFSSGCMLDFVTPATDLPLETSLSAMDLDTLRWHKLADGKQLFPAAYRWHYCCLDQDGTHAWLLGFPRSGAPGQTEDFLSDVLPIDLREFGLLGNKMSTEYRMGPNISVSETSARSHLSTLGADLASTFDQPPDTGSGADFTITAMLDEDETDNVSTDSAMADVGEAAASVIGSPTDGRASRPIHVHRFILSARWPHFRRLYNHQMREFHTRHMHIPEPYAAVKAFLFYLYTDSISVSPGETGEVPTVEDVADMLVMSNLYDMEPLRALCVHRLQRELDVQHAALIFDKASTAQDRFLRNLAASFCMTHWGRVVRTDGFRRLKRSAMLELCKGVDTEGRVVGGDELEVVGGLGGARFGSNMSSGNGRKRGRLNSISGAHDGDDVSDSMSS